MIVVVCNYRTPTAVNLQRLVRLLRRVPHMVVRTTEECRALAGEDVRGVIFSGGNTNPVAVDHIRRVAMVSLMFPAVPKLYICFGFEVVASVFGAPISRLRHREIGAVDIGLREPSHWLFRGAPVGQLLYRVNHVGYISEGDITGGVFRPIAVDGRGVVYACESADLNMFCVQFHPEASDDTEFIVRNFIARCGAF